MYSFFHFLFYWKEKCVLCTKYFLLSIGIFILDYASSIKVFSNVPQTYSIILLETPSFKEQSTIRPV